MCAQSCPTHCNPMDYSLTASSVHGILQARILEWVAISSPRGSSRPGDRTHASSCIAGRFFITAPPGKSVCTSYLCQSLGPLPGNLFQPSKERNYPQALVAQMVKSLPVRQKTWVWSLGKEDPLKKGMVNHSSILACRIPQTEEPGRLYSPWDQKQSDTTEPLTLSLSSAKKKKNCI